MAKELREVISHQEQQAAAQNDGKGNPVRFRFLQSLRSLIDYGQEAGHIDASLPEEAGIVMPWSQSEAPEAQGVVPVPKEEQDSQVSLRQAIAEYKRRVRTPEMWTAYWRAKFQVDGAKIGLNIEVPDCNWTEEEIRRPMKDIHSKEVPTLMLPLVPSITLPTLGRMYPEMQSHTVRKDSPVTDTHDTTGWLKVYASVGAPNRNTAWVGAEKFASEKGYLLNRESTYILASQASKDLQGKYFDQGTTFSWLPGSRDGDKFVGARFSSDGHLRAAWALYPGIPRQHYGWRFEEVKPGA